LTSYFEDDLFPTSTDAVIDAELPMFVAAWETVIGAKVAAKLLNMLASEFAVSLAAIRRARR
jgi:hypothetical protein